MPTLTEKDIKKIARLACLEINAVNIPKYIENLSKILDFVGQINKADTTNIEPIAHPLDGFSRFRQDQITQINQRELLQTIAPKSEAGLYLVPKVLDACEIT